ncbi:helix-turn-helix transcriptional regulator [Nonomuraea sp. NN258]|uniref:helix-turn-helix domain-containing protein n=1 Tax=Nonomuraea antri TaxID=2730852 RepID=UPI0015697CE8|nr:AraC family transcriptional regulator [Nonomuraea antri]NRQ33116.1 helix-turn-helix transcriptional regulator [Nonomuraea antri]
MDVEAKRFVAGGTREGIRLTGTETAQWPGALIVPAEPTVSLVVDLTGGTSDGFVTTAGRMYRAAAPVVRGRRAWASLTLTLPEAHRLLGGRLGELAAPSHRLSEVLGASGAELAERVGEARTWEQRFAAMRGFWADRTVRGPAVAPGVLSAWTRLVESGGRVPIGAVAADVGWSSQHLVRMFRRSFGLPPKTLARLLRLRGTLRRVRAEGRWEQAAFEAGYHDQAHFARDLRAFTGTSPSRYVRAALPCGCVRQVNSLQDRAREVP